MLRKSRENRLERGRQLGAWRVWESPVLKEMEPARVKAQRQAVWTPSSAHRELVSKLFITTLQSCLSGSGVGSGLFLEFEERAWESRLNKHQGVGGGGANGGWSEPLPDGGPGEKEAPEGLEPGTEH